MGIVPACHLLSKNWVEKEREKCAELMTVLPSDLYLVID